MPGSADAQTREGPFWPRLLDALVKLQAKVPADARSSATLGTEREGTGIVIDNDGLVLTIGYVMLEASEVTLGLPGGRTVPASIVAYDYETGFGLVRAAVATGVKPIELGQSATVKERDPVLVAAHGGSEAAMGAYIVSRREFAGYWEYLLDDALFTAPPHPRFGGAALLDKDGKLVGVGSLIVPNALVEPQVPGNMFLPIDLLKPILGDLLATGRSSLPRRPWLGLWTQEVMGRLFVSRVVEGSPAAQAGLEPGDLVLALAGRPVAGLADFYRRLWALGEPGVTVSLQVLKGNTPTDLTLKAGDRYDWLKLNRSL
ncbi:MAG: serine protease [Alphaproteobacteria bacterium]|nr:serine protease [Alphaproteobacteria bacterium]